MPSRGFFLSYMTLCITKIQTNTTEIQTGANYAVVLNMSNRSMSRFAQKSLSPTDIRIKKDTGLKYFTYFSRF